MIVPNLDGIITIVLVVVGDVEIGELKGDTFVWACANVIIAERIRRVEIWIIGRCDRYK